ncbi:MAG: hypothetical protein ABR875_03810 [Minisyncoccia bacterium]|jgi:hypothetical protein
MNVQETKDFLQEVWDGKLPLMSLIGRSFEGHFGPYHLAGAIVSLRKQSNGIFINLAIGEPTLRSIGSTVKFEIGTEAFTSTDFVLTF